MSYCFLLFVLNIADAFPTAAAANNGIVTWPSIDDDRERLKLIWSFSEAANRMADKDGI